MYDTKTWQAKISDAINYKKKWETTYRCDDLYKYYQGFHYTGSTGDIDINRKRYSLNVIYAAIKSKMAQIVYQNPQFLVSCRPGNMNWNQDFAVQSAQLKEDVLNTIVSNPNIEFTENIKLGALDSFFRFMVLEVGYSADWFNPNKPHLEMASHENPDIAKDRVKEDPEVPTNEQIYVRWIPADTFYVSTSDSPFIRNCAWSGYHRYMYRDVLNNTPDINIPTEYDAQLYQDEYVSKSGAYSNDDSPETKSRIMSGQVLKVWVIYDNVAKKRRLFLDEGKYEINTIPFERIPFVTHRWDIDLTCWYPVPPVFQWVKPQNEINEAREQVRNYRRRFTRKFLVRKGTIDPLEVEKFTNEIDGELIEVKDINAITALQNPEIGISISEGLIQSKDDFDIVVGIPTSRGRASDRQTATAVKKLSQEEAIRETVEQMEFNKIMTAAGREILLQCGERLSEGMWIKYTVDPGEEVIAEIQSIAPVYKYVSAQQIDDGYDFDIDLNVTNATPAQLAENEAQFVKFITMITQFPQLALSPTLIREAAYRVGYRNERVIKDFQKQAILALQQKAAMAQQTMLAAAQSGPLNQAPGAPGGNGVANGIAQRGQGNTTSEIQSQLAQQMGNA